MIDPHISAYINGLHDPDKRIRKINMETLAGYGKRAVPDLLLLLHDPDWIIRYRAAEALGLIQDPNTIENLLDLTNVRYMAAKSLGRMKDPRITPVLIDLLNDSHPYTRKIAAKGLAEINDIRAIDPLKEALKSESDTVIRDFFIETISTLKKEII
jgi:HEAT repeat protein